jgi:hypothetical protein
LDFRRHFAGGIVSRHDQNDSGVADDFTPCPQPVQNCPDAGHLLVFTAKKFVGCEILTCNQTVNWVSI